MFRILGFLLLTSCISLVMVAEAQPPQGKGGKGDKGDKKGFGKEGKGKFGVGTVIPPHVRGELDLTPEQEKQLKELESEVKARLEKILTKDQISTIESAAPPGGPPEGKGGFDKKGPPEGKGGADKKGGKQGGGKNDFTQALNPNRGIAWFATLELGLAEAKRTGKPILYVSAAPHCAGIPGIW